MKIMNINYKLSYDNWEENESKCTTDIGVLCLQTKYLRALITPSTTQFVMNRKNLEELHRVIKRRFDPEAEVLTARHLCYSFMCISFFTRFETFEKRDYLISDLISTGINSKHLGSIICYLYELHNPDDTSENISYVIAQKEGELLYKKCTFDEQAEEFNEYDKYLRFVMRLESGKVRSIDTITMFREIARLKLDDLMLLDAKLLYAKSGSFRHYVNGQCFGYDNIYAPIEKPTEHQLNFWLPTFISDHIESNTWSRSKDGKLLSREWKKFTDVAEDLGYVSKLDLYYDSFDILPTRRFLNVKSARNITERAINTRMLG